MDEPKNMGRLRYFDPNTTVFENREGTNSDSITFPYEDYNIAVDLQIRVYNRYSCGFGDMTGDMQVFEYSTQNGTLSFLGGTDGFLTTNYTDIQMINPSGNTTECLGIESIQVSYDSWLHPTVNVVFVDVKGGTVMQPAESHYYNEHEKGNTYQIYKSLFSFPYPLFLLKVKGFYGRGVTYRLAVSKTDIDFDANSGSFKISVDFIGHIYGLFADIPMTYIAVAPYMEEGDRYWMQKVNEKKFWFYKMDKNGDLVEQSPMLKFPELTLRVAEVAYSQPVAKSNADSELAMQTLDEEVNSLNSIMESYKAFIDGTNVVYFNDDPSHPDQSYIFYTLADSGEMRKNEAVSGAADTFFTKLEEHDKTYNTTYKSKFNSLYLIWKNKENTVDCEILEDGSVKRKAGNEVIFDIYMKNNPNLQKFVKEKLKVNDVNILSFGFRNFAKNGEDFNDIINVQIPDTIKKIQENKGKVEKEFKDKQNALIEDALGFRPSIKNMYDLAFAHLDTFMYVYYETLKKIRRQLEMKGDERKKVTYSVSDEYTDTEKSDEPGANGFVRGAYLPPYTGYYKDTVDAADNYKKKKTMMWPGDLPNGDRKLEEVKFVFDLLSGAKLYFDRSEEVNFAIEGFRASGSTGAISGRHPLTDVKRFIPLTIYDIANNGYTINPYLSVASKIRNNAPLDEVIGDVYGIFALRLFYYMNACSDGGQNRDSKESEFFGRLDAINFFKAVGKSESPVLHEFVKIFADNSNKKSDRKAFESAIVYNGNAVGTNVGGENVMPVMSWRVDGSVNTNRNLFSRSNGKYTYNYSKTDTVVDNGVSSVKFRYYPIRVTGMEDLKNTFSNGNPLYEEGFISSIQHGSYSGSTDGFSEGKTAKGGTFMLYETRDYIKTLYKNIEAELSQEKADNTNEITDNKFIDAYRGSSTLKGFANNIEEDFPRMYHKEIAEKVDNAETEAGRKDVATMTADDMAQFIIVYPDAIDEGRSKSQYDVNKEKLVDEADSLLECPLYWIQDNDYAKAFLFVQAARLIDGDSKTSVLGMDYGTNKIIQKAPLLREGAFYWWHENYEMVKTEGHCKFNIALHKSGGYDVAEGDVKYKTPTNKQTFISNYSNASSDYSLTYDDSETFNPIPYGSIANYYEIPYYNNNLREKTKNVTPSRVEYLKKYFENWVEKEFKPIARIYENIRIYGSPEEEKRKYSDGLDKTLLNAAITSGESNLIPDARKLQEFFRSFYFGVCTVFDYYGGFFGQDMSLDESSFTNGFHGFMDQLEEIYDEMEDASQSEINAAFAAAYADDPFRNKDLRLSTYMTLKSLYDKWICNSLKGDKTYRFNRVEDVNKEPGTYELDNFIYVDNFYRDIGYDLTINLTKFVEWMGKCLPTSEMYTVEGIMSYNGRTLYEFLTDIAQDCGAILLAIPQRFMYDCGDNIKTVFTPIPSCQAWDDDTYTYMFLYTYKPSEHLGDQGTSNMDMNGWSPEGDGYELTDEDIVGSLFDDNEIGYAVPAFGVTFAKENQAYFKNISLSTKQHGVTEAGLNATMNIATKASETIRETTLYGQDIYKVFANNSYECTVEMMGDMQIFPPMYFQLNNIPMWKGAYLIKKVTHNIRPGDVTTTIVGVRQNKYLIPMVEGTVVSLNTNENRANQSQESGNVTGGDAGITELSVGPDNWNGGPDTIIGGNRSKQIPEQNGLSEDITPTKPVIILTPGHSTGQKAKEHAWATRLIKDYIIPKLKQKTFKDGTSYADHVVQGGRKDRTNSESSSYDFDPVRRLVEKYGSNCVVSINVHWNGDLSNYWAVFYGQVPANACTEYIASNGRTWWKDVQLDKVLMRHDSRTFGEYMRAAFREVYNKREQYTKMPIGMMDGGIKDESSAFAYMLTPNNTDPGTGWSKRPTHCSCILTENFFPNFYPKGTKKINWEAQNWNEIDPETGRYCNGRGWLESEEGCNVIANAHVNGIVNYINSLGNDAANSVPTPPTGGNGNKTNVGLVEYCRAQLGRPYWYGTCGQISNQDLYLSRKGSFPSHYEASNFTSQYNQKVHDCIGLVKGYLWTNGPDDGNVKYGSNGFKDGNADTFYSRQTRKGSMSNIPAVPGLLVHAPGHAGVYDGNGFILQAANHRDGVIKTPITQGGWNWDGWAYIDGLTYV